MTSESSHSFRYQPHCHDTYFLSLSFTNTFISSLSWLDTSSTSLKITTPSIFRPLTLWGVSTIRWKQADILGSNLERFLVRILFCLFAQDTGIFEPESFKLYLLNRTAEDGSDLGHYLARLFDVLNTPRITARRSSTKLSQHSRRSTANCLPKISDSRISTGKCATRCSAVRTSTGRVFRRQSSVRSFRRSWNRRNGVKSADITPTNATFSK